MHPIRALVLKELRQHGWMLLALAGATAVALAVLVWSAGRAVRVLSVLDYLRAFLVTFIPLAGMVLGNRLVVQEYLGRNQLFLEGLPIRRLHLVATKFALGLATLIAMSGVSLALFTSLASHSEPIGARFLAILFVKSFSFVLFVWGVLFAMGFVGRFRIPIYIGCFLILIYLNNTTALDITRVGPLALLSPETFGFEREAFPWDLLAQTTFGALLFAGLGFSLALIREGSLAEALARRMSQREKATVGTVVLAGAVGMVALDEKRSKEPFRFQSDEVVRSDTLPISILYDLGFLRPEAEKHLHQLERSLGSMAEVLGIGALPPTRITYGYSLDAETFETAALRDKDGLLVRANYDGLSDRQQGDLEAYVIRGVLDLTTQGRSQFESKRWLHDGFSRWWASHGLVETYEAPDPILIARAIVATRYTGSVSRGVSKWVMLQEEVGEPLARALAYSGLKVLEEQAGRSAVLDLSRSVLGRAAPDDIREMFYEWSHPMAKVFSESTGEGWNEFLADWEDWLVAQAGDPALADLLAEVPQANGSIEVGVKEGLIRQIVGRFAMDKSSVEAGTYCSLLHLKLPPFDHEIHPKTLLREEADCSGGSRTLDLIGRYGAGERVFLALEFSSPVLDAPVRVASRRMVIQ